MTRKSLCASCWWLPTCNYVSISKKKCKCYKKNVKSNFKKITASPEELTDFIIKLQDGCYKCGSCDEQGQRNCIFGSCKSSKEAILEWLNKDSSQY